MHDVTLESVAAMTDHFAGAFVHEIYDVVEMYDVRKFDADTILLLEIKCKKRDI